MWRTKVCDEISTDRRSPPVIMRAAEESVRVTSGSRESAQIVRGERLHARSAPAQVSWRWRPVATRQPAGGKESRDCKEGETASTHRGGGRRKCRGAGRRRRRGEGGGGAAGDGTGSVAKKVRVSTPGRDAVKKKLSMTQRLQIVKEVQGGG
ncbi:unnamed protein product [Ectocarpus sp. CCAP 1310/34]|nr:unnamed protein product [Ectocarpus sp. CCAP 1310/34]